MQIKVNQLEMEKNQCFDTYLGKSLKVSEERGSFSKEAGRARAHRVSPKSSGWGGEHQDIYMS
jgi:hypothetical protein